MDPQARRHRSNYAAVRQPYTPSDSTVVAVRAASYPQSFANPYTPSQTANPTVTASPVSATGISGYPVSAATPYRPPQIVTPTAKSYRSPSPTVAATSTSNYRLSNPALYQPPRATRTSDFCSPTAVSSATPYRPPQAATPSPQSHPPTYPTATGTSDFRSPTIVNSATPYRPPKTGTTTTRSHARTYPTTSATRTSDFRSPTAVNSVTHYRPPQTATHTTRSHPTPPYSAAVNHPQPHPTNRPISRPDPAATPISGEHRPRPHKNEAIFHHDRRHQGPPNSNPDPHPTVNNPNAHLCPLSNTPWPVLPDITTQPDSDIDIEEEKSRTWAIGVQTRAMNSVQDFFVRNYGSESGFDSDEDEEDESDHHDYLTGLFERDDELRNFYENNWRKGEFQCLVCGRGKNKFIVKFKDCVALVQHSRNFLKTKKKAHRAYGKVICNLLRWDIHHLPSVADDPKNLQLQRRQKDDGRRASSSGSVW